MKTQKKNKLSWPIVLLLENSHIGINDPLPGQGGASTSAAQVPGSSKPLAGPGVAVIFDTKHSPYDGRKAMSEEEIEIINNGGVEISGWEKITLWEYLIVEKEWNK